jgi:chromosome segregation ATPase
MAQNSKIWIGPGVLRAVPDFKGEKVVQPGHEIPKGFVSSDRIKQLEKRGKICSESAFTKQQAAAGVVPVANAAGKIKTLEAEVKELEKANKELTEGAGLSVDAADKIKDFEAKIGELEGMNKAFEEEVTSLEEDKKNLEAEVTSLKDASKKGGK